MREQFRCTAKAVQFLNVAKAACRLVLSGAAAIMLYEEIPFEKLCGRVCVCVCVCVPALSTVQI